MDFETNVATLRRRSLAGAVLHLVILGVLLAGIGVALADMPSGAATLVLSVAALGLLWHFVRVVALHAGDRPRVVPYFPEKYFDRKASEESWTAFRGGYAIAKDLRQMNDLAITLGVTSLSRFGFSDDLMKQPPQWSSLDDGIRTLTSLISCGERLSPGTVADLATLAAALKKASDSQSTFSLLVRYGRDDFISGVEMSKRQGTFWC